MAIKAIINNTEKEIEQIKNSDGQDIDYVYSRIGDKEAEGESTVSIKSIGGELTNYRIYGNTINGESVGDRTANLWDEIYDEDGTLHYVPINVGDGFFTLSTTTPNGGTSDSSPAANIFFLAGNVSSGASTGGNGVWRENSRTIEAVDGYVTIAYRAVNSYGEQCYPWNNNTMLNLGSTPLPYEPYGYKVPVIVEGKNLLPTITATNSKNGILLRSESDGTVIVNGTATANTFFPLRENISYPFDTILSGCPLGGSLGYCLRAITPSKIYADLGSGIFIPANTEVYIEIRIEEGFECNNLEFKPMFCRANIMDYTYEPYHEPITTNLYLPEPLKMVGDEAEYVDFKEQKFHKIGADDINVTLPALSTIKGTNTLSVNTSIQPSNIYIKDGFDYKRVFTATRAIEGIPPLTYKAVEGALNNYRIYGNTVDGESVGDRTANLFANLWKKGYIRADNGREEQIDGFICSSFFPVEYGQTYSISRNIRVGYDNIRGYRDDESFIGAGTDICDVSNPFPSAATNIGTFTVTNENVAFIRFNDSANDLGMKYMIVKGTYTEQTMPDYEPYGYRVPVTIEGKNLLQNTASSQTKNDVTFTVNNDGSVTCNGTASNNTLFKIGDLSLASQSYILTGCPSNGGKYSYTLRCYKNGNIIGVDDGNGVNINESIDGYIEIRIASGYTCDNLTFCPMICKADIKDDTYEPYHEPITTNLYLPEQIKMVGDDAEYVDFVEQKQYFADGTSISVNLPTIFASIGMNTICIETNVVPSGVRIKGKFKKITTTYVQSIEPDNTNNKIIFVVRAYRSKNDRMVRTGLVATNDPAIGVNINVNSTVITSGCKVFVKELAGVTPTTNNTKYTWTKKVTDGEIWYVRSYVEYINSDNEQLIIYSDAAKASLDGIIKTYTIT